MQAKPSLNPTFKLLALLSRDSLSPDQLTIAQALLAQIDDVNELKAVIDQHATWVLVYQNILKHQLNLPADLIDYLQKTSRQVIAHNLLLAKETQTLCRFFYSHDIKLVVLKGIPLAERIYGNIAKRHSSDIDILVTHAQLDQARECMDQLGYQDMDHCYAGAAGKQWLEQQMHHSIYSNAKGICVELHWRLLSNRQVMPLSDQYWSESIAWPESTGQGAVLPDQDLLLFLCWHGSKHLWEQLKWLADIAELIDQNPWHWPTMLERAEQLQSLRPLLLGLLLSHYVFDTALPEPIVLALKNQPSVARLATSVIEQSFNGSHIWPNKPANKRQRFNRHITQTFFNLRLSSNLTYKLHTLNYAIMPSNSDFAVIKLPKSLFYLYYLIRPWRIFFDQMPARIKFFLKHPK